MVIPCIQFVYSSCVQMSGERSRLIFGSVNLCQDSQPDRTSPRSDNIAFFNILFALLAAAFTFD